MTVNNVHIYMYINTYYTKNAAEVDIAPASGKITKNAKNIDQGHRVKVHVRRLCQEQILYKVSNLQLPQISAGKKIYIKIDKVDRP